MKEGWEYKKLKEVGLTQTGTTPSKQIKAYYGGDIPFIRPAELNVDQNGGVQYDSELKLTEEGALKSRVIKANSVLMCCIGSVGKTGYTLNNVTCNQQINTLTPYDNYNSRFVYYALISPFFQQEVIKIANSAKATLPIISKGKWEILSIPVPPLSEQQSIVDYLDSAFAKIDAMKANAEKALNEAKALFQASLKEMLEPKEGWEEKTLLVLTSKIGSGATPKGGRKVYIDEGCHLIRSMNVQYNEFKYEDLAHITDEAAEQLKGVEIQENDVLFNITGASIARCCVVPIDALPARVNQHVSILRLKQDVLPRFLSYILNSPKHQRELLEIGEAGSTRQALTKTDLENHVICYPNIDSQTKLLCTLDSLKSKVDRLQANYDKISQECDALKQAILRQVFE